MVCVENPILPLVCCDKLQAVILRNDVCMTLSNANSKPMETALYLHDGSRHIAEKAEFCPFCGVKVKFKEGA